MEKAPCTIKSRLNIIIYLRKSSKKIKDFNQRYEKYKKRRKNRRGLEAEFIRRPSFRHVLMFDFILVPFAGNIQIAVAAAVLVDVFRPVLAGADNIGVFFAEAGRKAAGTAHVPVAFLVDQNVGKDAQNPLPVFVEEKTLGLLNLFHHVVEFFCCH